MSFRAAHAEKLQMLSLIVCGCAAASSICSEADGKFDLKLPDFETASSGILDSQNANISVDLTFNQNPKERKK